MTKEISIVHHADRRTDVVMPYAPGIVVRRGKPRVPLGVTAAAVYHSHPHRDEEFDLPATMREQAALTMENLKKTLEAAGCTLRRSGLRHPLPDGRRRAGRPEPRVGRVSRRSPADHHHGRGVALGHPRPVQARDQRDRRGRRGQRLMAPARLRRARARWEVAWQSGCSPPGIGVVGYNRTPEKARALVDAGLVLEKSPRAVAEAADAVFSMVTDSTALARDRPRPRRRDRRAQAGRGLGRDEHGQPQRHARTGACGRRARRQPHRRTRVRQRRDASRRASSRSWSAAIRRRSRSVRTPFAGHRSRPSRTSASSGSPSR